MKLSEKLRIVASWLMSEDNDLIVNAEASENMVKEAQANSVAGEAVYHAANVLGDAMKAWAQSNPEHDRKLDRYPGFLAYLPHMQPPMTLEEVQHLSREIGALECGKDPAVNKAATDLWQAAETEKNKPSQVPAPKMGSENDRTALVIVAEALVKAAEILNESANEVAKSEPGNVSVEMVEDIAALAEELDKSGLVSEAGTLDAALAILAAEKTGGYEYDEDRRTEELKKKYKDTLEHQHKLNDVDAARDSIKDSQWMKVHRMREAPLSTRVCPLHQSPLVRVGENLYQCTLDRQLFDWAQGYTSLHGVKVPGGSIEAQTQGVYNSPINATFQNRGDKTGINQ